MAKRRLPATAGGPDLRAPPYPAPAAARPPARRSDQRASSSIPRTQTADRRRGRRLRRGARCPPPAKRLWRPPPGLRPLAARGVEPAGPAPRADVRRLKGRQPRRAGAAPRVPVPGGTQNRGAGAPIAATCRAADTTASDTMTTGPGGHGWLCAGIAGCDGRKADPNARGDPSGAAGCVVVVDREGIRPAPEQTGWDMLPSQPRVPYPRLS